MKGWRPKGHHKFGAKPTTVDGIKFHSKREAARYGKLKWMEKVGIISSLELQPRFEITVNGQKICTYVGDFEYTENGVRVVEDVKGYRTPEYRLKSKLMLAVHGITIRET